MHAISFINDPMWRSYITTYPNGHRLCKDFVAGDVGRFKRLLTAQPARPPSFARVSPMAVATQREYRLFINGESSAASGGDPRATEPATGDPLATVAMAERGRHRPRRRRRPRRAQRRLGPTPPPSARGSCTRSPTRSSRTARSSPSSRCATSARRSPPSRPSSTRGSRTSASTPPRSGRRRPLEPARRLAPLLHAEGAGRRRGADHPVELPDDDATGSGARAGRRLHRRAQAGRADPAHRLRHGRARPEVGFPAGVINIVPGSARPSAAHLVQHPGVDKIAFTGRRRRAPDHARRLRGIKRLTLELGGKSPNIVFADADMSDAIPSSVWSIYYSAGQSCEARSRILVEQPAYDEFVAKFSEAASSLKVGDPLDNETQVGSLISPEHRDRVHGYVETGRAEGAEVTAGGEPQTARARSIRRPSSRRQPGHDRRPGGDLRPGGHDLAVRRREGRDPAGERAALWADGDRLDGRPGARASAGAQDQGGRGRINMPFTAFPGIPFGATSSPASAATRPGDARLYLETKSVIVSTSPKPFNPFGL